MKYEGSCHCGNVAFEVEGEFDSAMDCNCSMCRRRGGLLAFVPAENLRLTTPKEKVSTYTFNRHVIQHHFCANCGQNSPRAMRRNRLHHQPPLFRLPLHDLPKHSSFDSCLRLPGKR